MMTAPTSSFQIFKLLSIAGQWDKISRASTRRTFRKADLGFITFSHRSIDEFESGGLLFKFYYAYIHMEGSSLFLSLGYLGLDTHWPITCSCSDFGHTMAWQRRSSAVCTSTYAWTRTLRQHRGILWFDPGPGHQQGL